MGSQITIPWPPSATSKNGSQGDYRGKARAAKSYKADCTKACWSQKVRRLDHGGNIAVSITYCPPTRRPFDWDNISIRAKQGFDAVAEAVGVDDGRWWPVLVNKGPQKKGGAIHINFHSDGLPGVNVVPLVGVVT